MAKLFYTVEEAAQRLGKSQAEVIEMGRTGRLQEFRDRDRLMFKREQVDLVAESAGDDIQLTDEDDAISLVSDSGANLGAGNTKEQSGISIFDVEESEQADPSAMTQITSPGATEVSLESMGSGSGLLDLTREADDTSLGADLLEDLGTAGGSEAGMPAAGAGAALFEQTGAESDVAPAGAAMVMAVEAYDGPGSGVVGGMALGMVLVLVGAMALVIYGLMGVTGVGPTAVIGGNLMMWILIAAGAWLVCTIAGWLLGRR